MILFSKTSEGILKANTPSELVLGTIGKAKNTVNYSQNLDIVRNEEINLLSVYLVIKKKNIIILNQVHGDSIITVDAFSLSDKRIFIDADGMITNSAEICLVIRTADCVPVFAFDTKRKTLGAVHSGWRGCRLNIAGKLVRKMKSDFKAKNNDLHIYILPSIGPESYNVNDDVASFFEKDIIIKENILYCNLWTNIERSLIEEGVPKTNIHQSGICTYITNTDYFSFRSKDSGRNLNFGYIINK